MPHRVPSDDQRAGKQNEPFIPAISRRRAPVNGWVYFMLGEDTGRYKIGRAIDVEQRLKACQTGCSEPLSVYGVLPAVNPAALERAIHKRFASLRLHGEWFDHGGGEITDFVDLYGYELDGTHRIWDEVGPDDEPTPRLPPTLRL